MEQEKTKRRRRRKAKIKRREGGVLRFIFPLLITL
jgi:hypothetical protein